MMLGSGGGASITTGSSGGGGQGQSSGHHGGRVPGSSQPIADGHHLRQNSVKEFRESATNVQGSFPNGQ